MSYRLLRRAEHLESLLALLLVLMTLTMVLGSMVYLFYMVDTDRLAYFPKSRLLNGLDLSLIYGDGDGPLSLYDL